MIATALFLTFAILFVLGTPVAVALGLAGTLAIYLADLGLLAVPTSTFTQSMRRGYRRLKLRR